MNKEDIKKLVLLVIGGIAGIIFLVQFIYIPSIHKIGVQGTRIKELKEKIEKAEDVLRQKGRIEKRMKELFGTIKEFETQMPESSPYWLLERLNALAIKTGIEFDRIEPRGDLTTLGPYIQQGVDISLRTDYHTLGRFINLLENSSIYISVLSLRINHNPDTPERHLIRLLVGVYISKKGKGNEK